MDEREVFKEAIDMWGPAAQMQVAEEECAELIQAISKCIRNEAFYENLAEEIADVEICIEQLKIIFKRYNIEEHIAHWKAAKVERLKERMDDKGVFAMTETDKELQDLRRTIATLNETIKTDAEKITELKENNKVLRAELHDARNENCLRCRLDNEDLAPCDAGYECRWDFGGKWEKL